MMTRQALADWSATSVLALSSTATNTLNTWVSSASRPAVGTANVSSEAGAHCSVSTAGTLSIGSTGITLAWVESAADIGVTNVLRGTLAHCCSTIVLTECSLATGIARARVKVAVGVWVSGVVGATLANSIAS